MPCLTDHIPIIHLYFWCTLSHQNDYLHCCLWCLIKSSQLKQPPTARGLVSSRSTDYELDYDGFVRAGSDIKQAKFHNNVIQEPFFKSLPLGLYTTSVDFGIGVSSRTSYYFGHLLAPICADVCHQLDLSANLQRRDCGPSYDRYSSALHKLIKTKNELLRLQNELVLLATSASALSNPIFNNLATQVASMREQKKRYVSKNNAKSTVYQIICGKLERGNKKSLKLS